MLAYFLNRFNGDSHNLIHAMIEFLVACLFVYLVLWAITSIVELPPKMMQIVRVIAVLIMVLIALDIFGCF